MFVVYTALYGYSLYLNIIALSLILQFLIAYGNQAIFSMNSALVIDLFPGKGASTMVVSNLMRCSMGAAGVAVVQLAIDGTGAGPTFAIFARVTVACAPLMVV